MRAFFIGILFFTSTLLWAQDSTSVITLSEYLGYVKSFHPIVRQAHLVVNEGEIKLMKARGAFDPKFEVDYARKKFKGTEYYDKLNAAFKIPTWYGIEFKGNFEENTGYYLDPENTVPDDGLYSVGVSISLAKGLLTNKRMALLKQAKMFNNQAKADRQLLVNNILFDATKTYFNWLKTYNEKRVYEDFLDNAEMRFNGIKKNYEVGEAPAIDTLEARIALNNRKLSLEKANINYIKASLELSNFLWLSEDTPVEIRDHIIPDITTNDIIDQTLNTSAFDIASLDLDNHPKMLSLDYKLQSLNIEKNLSINNLLPTVDLQYNFLSQTPEIARSFSTSAYKSGLNVSIPLFLRKERSDLKLAKLKILDTEFEIQNTRLALKNKIDATNQTLTSYKTQSAYLETIVDDYQTMLTAEERKFYLGESSLFLVNSRESKLIDAKLKAISLETDYLNTKASMSNILALEKFE
ncbi:TolC family protein [Gaetbulibacter saemankumensis]|uniref:TolC family protein n=1 Tax=Gaetbulibacter saemankumensis TaxID=311208 RepID=UPI0003F71F0E|nr:TolC family protein [Gaetbulibacter saemankumensis]